MLVQNKRRVFLFLIYGFGFILIPFFFFFLYTKALLLELSPYSLLYSTLFIAGFITALCGTKKIFWLYLLHIFLLCFLVFSLANVAYVHVFQKMMPLSLSWWTGSRIDPTFFAQYFLLVPWFLYAASVIYLGCSFIAGWVLYHQKKSSFSFCGNIIREKYAFPKSQWIIGMFVCIELLHLAFAQWQLKYLKDNWWNARQYSMDTGVVGHISIEFFQALSSTLKKPSIAIAQTQQDTPVPVLTAYMSIRNRIEELYALQKPTVLQKIAPRGEKETTPPHIIFYQLESVSAWVFEQNPTPMPFLKALEATNLHVDHFIPNGCSTINAEFSTLCSAFSFQGKPISETPLNQTVTCLPEILKKEYGYTTAYTHANDISFYNRETLGKSWGFDELYFFPYFNRRETSDTAVFDDILSRIEKATTPTLNYLIGYGSHSPHKEDLRAYLQETQSPHIPPYRAPIIPEIANRIELSEDEIQIYLWFMAQLDDTIKHMFTALEEHQLLDNTIVVIFGDHRYYNFPGNTKENFFQYNDVPFMIYAPGTESQTLASYASNIDIAPTILHLIEKDTYQPREQFVGTSLFSEKHPNFSLLKCLGYSDFADPNTIIEGSSEQQTYHVSFSSLPLNKEKEQRYISSIDALSRETDALITQ